VRLRASRAKTEAKDEFVLANLLSLVGAATDIALDRIQSCDPFQSFFQPEASVGLFEVIELAANVRPTRHLLYPIIFIKLMKPAYASACSAP